MSDFTKRFLIVFGLFLVTIVITFGAYSMKSYSGTLYTKSIPMIIGSWYGIDLPMEERTYEILETKDAVMIKYTNLNNDNIFLSIVFSQNNRKVAHPPEVCFAGGGWSRVDRDIQTVTIDGREVKLNRLILEKDANKQVVLYLYKAGRELTSSYYAQQFNIILNSVLRKDTSSALIRISAYTTENNTEETTDLTKRFAGEIIPILDKLLP